MSDQIALPRTDPAARPTLGQRVAARAIDAVIVGLVGIGIGVLLEFSILWLVLQATLVYGYFVALDAAMGATIGKRALGLRVDGPAGGRPTLSQALTRESFVLLGAIPFAGPLLALAAWVAILLSTRSSPSGQGIHDRVAGGTGVARA
jgi:uncharacterized RDD family membrane protein YckC